MGSSPSGADFTCQGQILSQGAGIDAQPGQVLTLQLLASPALDVTKCVYSVFSTSPGAPLPTLQNGGVPSSPTAPLTLTLPALTEAATYCIQCQTNGGVAVPNAQTGRPDFTVNTKRGVVAVRNALGLRKMFVGESVEYAPAGWVQIVSDLIDALGGTTSGVIMIQRTSTPNPKALSASISRGSNNWTIPAFSISGVVRVKRLWGMLTSSPVNHTAQQFIFNASEGIAPQNADLCAAASTPLSGLPAGTLFGCFGTGFTTGSPCAVLSAASIQAQINAFAEYEIVPNPAAILNTIVLNFSSTDATPTGAMQFFCEWGALSAGASVIAL